jgi:hypothetical protein
MSPKQYLTTLCLRNTILGIKVFKIFRADENEEEYEKQDPVSKQKFTFCRNERWQDLLRDPVDLVCDEDKDGRRHDQVEDGVIRNENQNT